MSPANKFSHAHIIDYTAVHQDSMYTNTSTVQYGTPLEKKSLILIRGITLSRWSARCCLGSTDHECQCC